ncbi:Inhibitor of Bruton tyrosine kinase [Holothuria leucospilota]|uniref:Inhibitor of Bruton tyrosine kinase n=1 Tax=Holothuria leucospilota TaxID=206669 RepID=A0A9Q1BGI6_HOLLE|nr:Inhibitor of Bruton tyrosine kinase [Holothuria leucospilota]
MDCTSRCQSREHATDIINVITSSATEEQIKAYIAGHCHRSGHVCDAIGRTALHVAASCGKGEVLRWLVEDQKADLRTKDGESGWTALHRSIFYGQLLCAVKLIQFGSSLKVCDFEDLYPLDIAMKDKPPHVDYSIDNPCNIYTWGTNSNFTLGHSNQQSRSTPDVVDEFLRKKFTIRQVCMSKFHTAILTSTGKVLTCGHGQGGRLGHGNEQTCMLPKVISGLVTSCEFVATARDHTLFLMEDGRVYGCGQNRFCQLGITSDENAFLKPRQIIGKGFTDKKIVGVVAAKYHSVFYTEDQVYTCGLNGGQIGHAKGDKFVTTPKLVTSLNHKNMTISTIAASEGVTVCSTSNGDIYLLQNYICRKIVNKQLNIRKMVVVGGKLESGLEEVGETRSSPLVIVLLHKNGKVLSWQLTDETLRRCSYNRKRQLIFTDVDLNRQGVILSTTEGQAFKGHFTHKKVAPLYGSSQADSTRTDKSQGFIQIGGVEQVDREKSELINLQRIPYCHRVTRAACDPQGNNFAVLQNDARLGLTELPEVSCCQMKEDLKRFYSEGSLTDNIHDVELKVGLQSFPAHKFILAARSEFFKKLLLNIPKDSEESGEDYLQVHLNRNIRVLDLTQSVSVETLQRILLYIYTNSCDVFDWNFVENVMNRDKRLFERTLQSIKEGKKEKNKTGKKKTKENRDQTLLEENSEYLPVMAIVKQVKEAAKTFGILSLYRRLELVKMKNTRLDNFRPERDTLTFDRKKFEDLSDILLQSEDNVMFSCHRCILVARLEYFNSMLASGWIEASSSAPLMLPVPASVLSILLDFIYTSNTPMLPSQDMELVCNVLVTADQLLLPRLKEISEVILVDMISLRNVAQLLEFASMYQAHQLKASCQQFIGLNIVMLLENQSLDILSDDVLTELSKAYRDMIPGMSRRMITPYSTSPSPSDLPHLIAEENKVDNLEEVIFSAKARRKARRKSSGSERVSRSSETEKVKLDEVIDEDEERKRHTPADSDEKDKDKKSLANLTEEKENTRPRLTDMFCQNKEKWLKVKEGSTGRDVSVNNKNQDTGGDRDMGVNEQNRQPGMEGKKSNTQGRRQKKNKRNSTQVESESDCQEKQAEVPRQDKSVVSTTPNQDKLPGGDGRWMKKGQEVTVVSSPKTNPMEIPLSVSVTPWQSPPSNRKQEPGLKDIIAAELAKSSNKSSGKWSAGSGSGKKSQSQRKRESLAKMEAESSAPTQTASAQRAWGAWSTPTSPSSSHKVSEPLSQADKPASSRKISFGSLVGGTQEDHSQRNLPSKSSPTSPVSPLSPTQSSVWGSADSQPAQTQPPSVSFTEIVQNEKEAKKNLDKALNKSLQSIQIEEQAMAELLQMYEQAADHAEYITVKQVRVEMANPHWTKGVT